MSSAEEYLRDAGRAMAVADVGDCLEHARIIRDHLLAEGREAWIGRLRKTSRLGETTFHGPLTPLRFRGRGGPTWTTHYVCCCDGKAFDPLIGEPVPLSGYSIAVFGEEIEIERL